MFDSRDRRRGLRLAFGYLLVWTLASPGVAQQVLLEDDFDHFDLGELWQEHGSGAPDIALGAIQTGPDTVLQMISSGVYDDFLGIETREPLSLAGRSELTVAARLRPINQGVEGSVAAAELALVGSSGEVVRIFASNNAGPDPDSQFDWGDHYEDSLGNTATSGAWPHCDVACDAMRTFVLQFDDAGIWVQAFDDLDSPNAPTWETQIEDFMLADFGTHVTVALRQFAVDGGDQVMGFFDYVRVTSTSRPQLPGDFDDNGILDGRDLDQMSVAAREGATPGAFDLNGDGQITRDDRSLWLGTLRNTWAGDANMDGEFNSADFVSVFAAGEYQDDRPANSRWETGDWDGDLEFTSSDFVFAFTDGGYEQGPRQSVRAVPEPASGLLLAVWGGTIAHRTLRRRQVWHLPVDGGECGHLG